jgi:PAS domain S-box-containing protein
MKDQSLRVLMVEDSEDDALLIIRELKKGGYNPLYERVETPTAMKKALQEKQWDIILCDYKMPKFNASSAIAILKEANIDIPIIIVSGTIGEDMAIECMRLGAQDYIMKSNLSRLCPAIARELEDAEVRNKQRQADEDLKESENKYRLSFENVTDVIYTLDTGLTILSLSPSVETILGYKPQDFIGRSVSDLGNILTPESFEQAIADISVILNGEKISATIYQFIAKDGTIKYGEVSGSPLMSKGKIIGIISVARDITDRRRVESQREVALKALQESEKKYRELYDFLPIPVYEMDFDANIISANRAIYETFRGTEEDLKKGIKGWQLLSPEEIEKSKKNIQALLKGKQIAGTEYTMMRLDGSVFPAIVISSVIYSDGKPVGLRGAIIDITERKQAEEALHQNEEKYRNILENIQEGYYEVDLAGNLTFFNDSLCRTIGSSKEELMGMNYQQYEDKESLKKVFQTYNKVYKTGEPIKGFGRQIIRNDGTKRYVEVSVSLQKDSSGKPIGFRGISRDVTERKQMEDMISQSEERYRTILDEMDNGYFEVDLAGNYTFINNSICRQLGYSKEEMLGLNFRVPMVKESIEIVYNAFKNIYITGKPQRGIYYKARRKDGTTGSAEVSGFPLKNKKGESIGFRGIAVNVTERKQMEEALRQSEEKYRNILENIQEGYYEVDLAGNLTFFNSAFCRIYGYTKEELMGMNYRQYTEKEHSKELFQAFNKVYSTGEPKEEFDWQAITKDGNKRDIELSASLQKDSSGKPIGFRGISRDITERKQAEDALRQSEEKYRTILEDMEDVYFEVDIKGNITFVNTSSYKMSGYAEKEMLGMSFKKISAPDGIEMVMQYFGEIFLTGKTGKPFLWNLVKKNGEQGFFELIASLITDKQGKPIGFRGIGRDVTERKKTEEVLQQTLASLRKAFGTTIQVMVSAVEMRDPYTAGHQLRVADIARSVAKEMGLPDDKIDGIRLAGSIHDIGKLSIPAEILSKPTKLTDLEFSLIKEHPQIGYEMLKDVESQWPLAQIVYQHHERMNGSGYPRNLKGDEILIEARIMAVADVVEAMASHRPYRPGLGIEAALEEIEKNKGIVYDNAVADACLKLFREKNYKIP